MNHEENRARRAPRVLQSRADIRKAKEIIRLNEQAQQRGELVMTGEFITDKAARARRRFEQTGVYKRQFGKKRRVSKLKQSLKRSSKYKFGNEEDDEVNSTNDLAEREIVDILDTAAHDRQQQRGGVVLSKFMENAKKKREELERKLELEREELERKLELERKELEKKARRRALAAESRAEKLAKSEGIRLNEQYKTWSANRQNFGKRRVSKLKQSLKHLNKDIAFLLKCR